MATRFNLVDHFKSRRHVRDERRHPRRAMRSQGWIRLQGDFAVQSCTIVDMSPAGARLRVEPPNRVPDDFRLLLSRQGSRGYRCHVKWRRGPHLGVVFV